MYPRLTRHGLPQPKWLAVPMWLLFEVGLLFGGLVRRPTADDEDNFRGDQPPAPGSA